MDKNSKDKKSESFSTENSIFKNSHKVFNGVRFNVHSFTVPGKQGKPVQKDVIVHPGAVVVLPILSDNNIVMIRNQRFAVGKELWELPAGTLEPAEPPLETAKRELIEETGYQADKVDHLITFYPSPGICNEIMYAYVAKGLEFVGQHLDETEEITVEIISWDKALAMVRDGIICDAKSMMTILYYHTYLRSLPF